MSTTDNKELMKHIFSELSRGNSRPLIESLADDFCWTVPGTTEWSKTYHGKQEVLTELLQPPSSQFANQYANTAHRFNCGR